MGYFLPMVENGLIRNVQLCQGVIFSHVLMMIDGYFVTTIYYITLCTFVHNISTVVILYIDC